MRGSLQTAHTAFRSSSDAGMLSAVPAARCARRYSRQQVFRNVKEYLGVGRKVEIRQRQSVLSESRCVGHEGEEGLVLRRHLRCLATVPEQRAHPLVHPALLLLFRHVLGRGRQFRRLAQVVFVCGERLGEVAHQVHEVLLPAPLLEPGRPVRVHDEHVQLVSQALLWERVGGGGMCIR